MADEEIEQVIEMLSTSIDDEAGDVARFSQQDSIDIYEGVILHCRQWIETIRSEIDG